MKKFIVNINTNRFEIPQDFCKTYSKEFCSNDVIVFRINNKILMGTINVHKDGNTSRKRLRIPNYFFDDKLLGKNRIEILQHIKEENRIPAYSKILVKMKGKLYVDLYKIIPNKDSYNTSIRIVEYNKKLYLFKPFTQKIVSIRRFVDYYRLLEILGLYQGEGIRKLKNYGKIQFSNSKIEIINKFLNFFEEELGLKRNNWKAFIGLTGYKNIKREQKALDYWFRKIKIPKENFRKINYTKTFGKLHGRYGAVVIILDATALSHCFVGILKNINKILKNEKDSWFFINGLLEADGSVAIKRNGDLSDLYIAYDVIEEALLYKKIIEENLNIQTKINEKRRVIYLCKDKRTNDKWWTWYRLIQNNCFKDHLDRKNKLIKGFLNHKKTKIIYKCLNKFSEGENLNTQFLLKSIGYKTRKGLRYIFKELEDEGFLNIKRIKNYYLYNININGKDFLDTYKNLLNNSYQNNKLF